MKFSYCTNATTYQERQSLFLAKFRLVVLISVSAILQLAAGDAVNIAAISSTTGVLFANPPGIHFEAARLPSPENNDPPFKRAASGSISIWPKNLL
jgi:hypothetical protein